MVTVIGVGCVPMSRITLVGYGFRDRGGHVCTLD